ncbi:MAG: calcium-binding protein [Gloeocapsa sp. UFS-A4-WI-NPMV-4B04]|nr:calcium-binding protein [Gloeocapsa sp. UFS-A4-WI-NPMV-4B04]
MQGGAGNDAYVVDRTTDQTIESANGGVDQVQSSISWTLATNVEDLILTGSADINGTGNELNNIIQATGFTNNIIKGGGGNDFILGEGGNDTLIGQVGVDRLSGSFGADKFVFNSTSEGIDTIEDYEVSVVGETIQVSRAGFGGGLSLGTLAASQFVIGTAAVDTSDRFIYNSGTGALFFDPTGSNNGITDRVQFAQLATGLAMTNNDIFVIG